jgi:hypothetical protein
MSQSAAVFKRGQGSDIAERGIHLEQSIAKQGSRESGCFPRHLLVPRPNFNS